MHQTGLIKNTINRDKIQFCKSFQGTTLVVTSSQKIIVNRSFDNQIIRVIGIKIITKETTLMNKTNKNLMSHKIL